MPTRVGGAVETGVGTGGELEMLFPWVQIGQSCPPRKNLCIFPCLKSKGFWEDLILWERLTTELFAFFGFPSGNTFQ